jgi:hypothetical protein
MPHQSDATVPVHTDLNHRQNLCDQLKKATQNKAFWSDELNRLSSSSSRLHLGVFVEPYLTYILQGEKTIESRFSINRTPPYGRVCAGDVVLLKRSGGPIIGICRVSRVWSYELTTETWKYIRSELADELRISDPAFWRSKQTANYATLMAITHVTNLNSAVQIEKRDRRGWVVIP